MVKIKDLTLASINLGRGETRAVQGGRRGLVYPMKLEQSKFCYNSKILENFLQSGPSVTLSPL